MDRSDITSLLLELKEVKDSKTSNFVQILISVLGLSLPAIIMGGIMYANLNTNSNEINLLREDNKDSQRARAECRSTVVLHGKNIDQLSEEVSRLENEISIIKINIQELHKYHKELEGKKK